MAGRQTFRLLIAGLSGGGKSTLARRVIQKMDGRYKKLIIVNRKAEFAEFCTKHLEVFETGDPSKVLERHDKVFFRVDGLDPRPFLDNLGLALMAHRDALLVVDEAWEFFQRGRVPKGLFRVITGGRELGHNCIFITQMLQSATGGIDLAAIEQATHVAFLRLGPNDQARAAYLWPQLGSRVLSLKRPGDPPKAPPEYAVVNRLNLNGVLLERTRSSKLAIHKIT